MRKHLSKVLIAVILVMAIIIGYLLIVQNAMETSFNSEVEWLCTDDLLSDSQAFLDCIRDCRDEPTEAAYVKMYYQANVCRNEMRNLRMFCLNWPASKYYSTGKKYVRLEDEKIPLEDQSRVATRIERGLYRFTNTIDEWTADENFCESNAENQEFQNFLTRTEKDMAAFVTELKKYDFSKANTAEELFARYYAVLYAMRDYRESFIFSAE